jgi:pSer/pThr/pTyr-binding forkhead associated (FHA) protein
MSVEPVLLALKALFLVLLYFFIWRVIRSASRDMRVAPQESFILAPSQLAAEHPAASGGRFVVERSKVLKPGRTFEAGPVPLTIGRSEDNAVALKGDEFASGHHARQLREGDVVQIGDTELRFER